MSISATELTREVAGGTVGLAALDTLAPAGPSAVDTDTSTGIAGGTGAVSSADAADPGEVVSRLLEQAHAALVAAAGFPDLPQELTLGFLKGLKPEDLSQEERDALALSYAAELRLTGLLDRFGTGLSSLRAKSLVRGQAHFELTNNKAGHKTFPDLLGQASGKGSQATFREMRTAQTLGNSPEAQSAIDEGLITMDHVDALARARATAHRSGGEELTAKEESLLVGMAKTRTADQYSKDVNRFMAGRNPLAHDASHEQIQSRRYFNMSRGISGTHLRGFIDPVAAEVLSTALAAASARPGPDDDRTPEQRRADALIEVAKTPLKMGTFKSGAHVRPHVSVIMTEQTFAHATFEAERREKVAEHERLVAAYECQVAAYECQVAERAQQFQPTQQSEHAQQLEHAQQFQPTQQSEHAQRAMHLNLDLDSSGPTASSAECELLLVAPVAPVAPAPLDPALLKPVAMEPAEFEDGTAIPFNELAMILCDCTVTRVVLNADGVPTDLGRTERVYAKELYRAVVARDRTCRFEGCHMPSHLSEVHHIKWWGRDNGVTSVENGVVACRYHHGLIHSGTLEVVKNELGLPFIVPVGKSAPAPTTSRSQLTSLAPPAPSALTPMAPLGPLGPLATATPTEPASAPPPLAPQGPLATATPEEPAPAPPPLVPQGPLSPLTAPVPAPATIQLSKVEDATMPSSETDQPPPPLYLPSPNIKVFRDSSAFMSWQVTASGTNLSGEQNTGTPTGGHQSGKSLDVGPRRRVGRLKQKVGTSVAVDKSFDLFASTQ